MSESWYPTINKEKCVSCNRCVSHCHNGVLGVDEDGKAIVINPENCVTNCWGCLTICRAKAITLPRERYEKKMGCNACGRSPCRFGARGVSTVTRNLSMCQGMATLRMLQLQRENSSKKKA